uniref:Uncharacterized protein n=1 Tax=Rhizophora mucronata TaxID=61149 RepID=A0A2P2PE37_RHIMU
MHLTLPSVNFLPIYDISVSELLYSKLSFFKAIFNFCY